MNSEYRSSTALEKLVDAHAQHPPEWTAPDRFDLSNAADCQEVTRRFESGQIKSSIDRRAEVANDLFDMHFPHLSSDTQARGEYAENIKDQGLEFGSWFHFKWNQTLVRYPDMIEHQSLRTYRNKNLITDAEQQKMLEAKVAIFGLSVGSNIVEQLAQGGIGGTMIMGDYDTLSPTNLNRVKASMAQVGMRKLDLMAIKVSEIDPYIHQVHFHDGVTQESLSQLADIQPDIIFDEVDDLAVKVMLRHFAKDTHTPLAMVTDLGDKPIIDVERYDVHDPEPFGGRINQYDIELLESASLTPAQKQKMMMKIVGIRHITPRLLESAMHINKTLGGLPQLGTTAAAGGSLGATVAREILLGRKLKSGRYISSPKRILKMQNQTNFTEATKTVFAFNKSKK